MLQLETDRFKIIRKLGEGGMGAVYEAWDRTLGAPVAIKVFSHAGPKSIIRSKREFRVLWELFHENLVRVYEFLELGDVYLLVMELVEGVDFLTWVTGEDLEPVQTTGPAGASEEDWAAAPTRPGPVVGNWHYREARLVHALSQLVDGLEAIHASGHIHRDVKPSNVLVERSGRLVLLDFGLARPLPEFTHPESPVPTGEGDIVGTVAYMAPEVATTDELTPAADWYSVGVLLYEALTGQHPHTGSFWEVLVAKQKQPPRDPRELNPRCNPALALLALDLLTPDPRLRPDGGEIRKRLQRLDTWPTRRRQPRSVSMSLGDVFVGREEELDSLLGAWKSASAGTAAAVCVRGESGVGKSALLLRFVQTLREREGTDILVFRSRCYEKENVSYKAFAGLADALGAYLVRVDADRLLHILPPDFPAVARIFPALGHSNLLRGSQLSLPEDPAELRVRAISGFGSLLVRLSRHKPTVVLLDDIQWADQESLRLLESLARHLMREPDAPVLLLLGRRTGVSNPDLDDLLARLAREGFLRFLDVHPLGEDEIRELVARLLARTGDAAKLAPKWSRTIARHAAGNPFLAGEMVRYVQREAEKHSVSSSDIELADALWKRVTDLEPLAQDILVLASLAGGAITEDVLAEACGKHKGDKEWRDTLHELAVLRLVHRVTAAGEDAYEPYHDRIREEIRERIDPNRRREVHRRLALAFERRPDRYAEAAAWHWWEAGEREAAKKHYVRAARQAAERLAFLRAAQLFGMALQEEKDPKQRALLAMEQGEAYRNAGHALQAVSSFDRAIRDASDAALRLRAQFLATEQLLKAGYVERASAGVGRVFKALGESLPGSGFQAVAALLWQRSALRLQGLEYEARDPSQIPERDKTVADILGNLSIGFSMVDPVLSGYLGARFLRLVLEMGDEERIATGLALEAALSSARSIRGQPRAKQLIAQSAAIATRLDVPKLAALTKLAQGVTHYFAGEWTSCIRTLEAALEVLRRKCYGVGWELATTITYLTFAYMMRGQLSRAWQLMEENIEDATQRGDMFLVANLQTIVGIVLLAQDQADELARRLENLLDTWPRDRYTVQHFYLLYSESELSLYRGDVERAWNLLTSQWRPLTRHQLHRFLIIRAEFWRALGRVALAMAAQSEGKDRQRYLKTAAKVAKRLEAERTGYTSAWAGHLRAGIAYLREGPTARVASLYEQAASELRAGEMEMHALSAEARHAQIVGDEARLKQTFDAMRREGVQKPEQFVNILSPGFS